MDGKAFDDIEITPPAVVKQAARDFAAALTESPQCKGLEQAAERFRLDPVAQQAYGAYQEKQIAWRALLMLNALSAEQKAELEDLKNAFVNQTVVQEYFKAQTEFETLCQSWGDAVPNPLV